MIPVPRMYIKSILDKRKGLVRVNCILCERKIGWLHLETVKQLMDSRGGNCLCESCYNESLEAPGRLI